MKSIFARLTFTEDLLGTAPSDPEIYRKYIATKAPDAPKVEDEVASVGVDEMVEKGMTIFARDKDGNPHLWDYQIKGFFKGACGFLRTVEKADDDEEESTDKASDKAADAEAKKKKKRPAYESGKLTSYKTKIDGLIFVFPRKIMISMADEMDNCQRPLRTSGPTGDRVALANSEAVPAGSYIDIEIRMLDDHHEKLIREWLDYGIYSGLGQWRNSGKGRFTWVEIDKLGGEPIEEKAS